MAEQQAEREWCEMHREWYVPYSATKPCPGCRLEAEAHWARAEDRNIRTLLEMPDA